MIIYYSGGGCKYSNPEILFKNKATLMLTAEDKTTYGKSQRQRLKVIYRVKKRLIKERVK